MYQTRVLGLKANLNQIKSPNKKDIRRNENAQLNSSLKF